MTTPSKPCFEENRVRAILARAIEIDARAGSLTTLEDLHAIAADVGVSPQALEAALGEDAADQRAREAGSDGLARAVAAAGLPLGVAAGLAISMMQPFDMALAVRGLGALGLLGSSAIIVTHATRASLRSFNAHNLALWGGYAAGALAAIAVAGGQSAVDLPWLFPLSSAIGSLLTTSMLGSAAMLAFRRASTRRRIDSEPSDGVADGPRVRVLLAAKRMAHDLAERLAALTRREGIASPRLSSTVAARAASR